MRLINQILSPDNLRAAWEEVAENKGVPGMDRVSITRWRRNWEERCADLAAKVRANTYRPSPLRRFTIPKKDGTPVQYSVFECLLDAKRAEKMKAAVRKITRPRKDNVRYYSLCAACVQKIEAPGGDVVTEPSKAVVV